VLDLLRLERSTSEIAERLFVPPAIVRSHIASVLCKLGAPNRVAAVRLFDAH
jgi:DNA-binding CsgD family transcriptional regulator